MPAHSEHRGERSDSPEGSGTRWKLTERTPLPPRAVRVDLALLFTFSVIWLLAVLALFHVLPLAGTIELGLYRLYSVAAVLGWVSGNIYMTRRRILPPSGRWRKRLLLAYLLEPPGIVFLLRSLAPVDVQQAAPFVPIYGLAVYAIFFLVPVTLRGSAPPRAKL